ncbi:MAG: 4-hydroxy-tetrahydrodipicolinate synthase [Deltaproteobacteria bacterium]|nr:4-hydroxy-tetrahydrodipicolinate synthase [Deltaproteobacteria bacterium]MBI3294858.1 4-hydroxy-tetrahydrodipicolinate synthase [Deltaproteobacteria bacterium]
MRFEGVYVALVTPFDGSGCFDSSALSRHLSWLAGAGVAGFVPCGTTGEAPTLTEGERDEIILLSLGVARDRGLKVIAGCGSNSTEAARRQVLRARELGCDAALVVTPYYNKPTQPGLDAHYRCLADASDLPIVLYNVPSRTGVNLLPDTTRNLLLHPNIVGLKEASGIYGQWLELSNSVDWRERSWLAGDDDAFAVTMSLGGAGTISATANVIPRSFVELFSAAKAGNLADAFRIQRAIQGVVKAAFVESNPGPIKAALKMMARMEDGLRLPLVRPTAQSCEVMRKALVAQGVL